MTRRWELDALRGLMLVLMTLTHLPTRLSSPLGQPFGFVSAAEGFVLLSAYMAGMVYARMARKKGIDAMRGAFWRRALKVYACHAATLFFLFTVIAAVGLRIDQPAVKDLMSFYLAHPATALLTGLMLIYTPPLLDILPMYILFMLVSPWVLAHALRHGWFWIVAGSVLAWGLAQLGLGLWVYQATVAVTGLSVPFQETGSFATFSWQLLWVLGLWMGAGRSAEGARPLAFARWVTVLAVLVALVGFIWRHHGEGGQAAFGGNVGLNLLFDKWLLGPLRLLDLLALVAVVIHFGPWLKARVRRVRWLETLGAASLPVFCAHLMIVLLVLAIWGANPYAHAWWTDAALLLGCFASLYGVARVSLRLDRPQRLMDGPCGPMFPAAAAVLKGAGVSPPLAAQVPVPAPGASPGKGQAQTATAGSPPH
ncbi:OpgC domain-containing protein [Polaromonas sp. OV174]|uniref:OpgC domain-containing protein n=1 Tax=Polaromonas sp. OV174 TaxID=1855300 RepID=UPI000B898C27|nr:OpgC domain-containing protein [Polaromonas sp. OV174]